MPTAAPRAARLLFETRRGACALYLLVAALVHFPGLGRTGLVCLEAMAATTTESMLESRDFVVPELYGEIYTYKPPLLYWLTAGSVGLFGSSEWAQRLPGALLSTLAGLTVLLLVCRVSRPRTGLYAALATITGFLWMQKSRQGDFDIVLAALVGIAVAGACHNLAGAGRRVSPGLWLAAYAALAAGFLTKGVPAAMAFLPGLVAAAVLTGRARRLATPSHLLAVALGLVLVASYVLALWLAIGSPALAQPLAEAQHRGFEWTPSTLGRTLLKPLDILAAFLPWSLVWPWSLPSPAAGGKPASRRLTRLSRAAWGFLGGGALAFMAVPTAETRYYLPLAVPAAIVSAVGLERLASPSRLASRLLHGTVALFAAATLVLALAPLAVAWSAFSLLTIGLLAGAALVPARRVARRHRAAYLLLVAALCAWAVELTVLRPHRGSSRVLASVARELDRELPPGATVWAPGDADHAGRNGSLYHYLQRPVRTFSPERPLPAPASYVLLTAAESRDLEHAAFARSARLALVLHVPNRREDFLLYRVDRSG